MRLALLFLTLFSLSVPQLTAAKPVNVNGWKSLSAASNHCCCCKGEKNGCTCCCCKHVADKTANSTAHIKVEKVPENCNCQAQPKPVSRTQDVSTCPVEYNEIQKCCVSAIAIPFEYAIVNPVIRTGSFTGTSPPKISVPIPLRI